MKPKALYGVLCGYRGREAAMCMRRIVSALLASAEVRPDDVERLLKVATRAGELSPADLEYLSGIYGRPRPYGSALWLAMLESAAGELLYGLARDEWSQRRELEGRGEMTRAIRWGSALGRASVAAPLGPTPYEALRDKHGGAWLVAFRVGQVVDAMACLHRDGPAGGVAGRFRQWLGKTYARLGREPPPAAPGEVDGASAYAALRIALVMATAPASMIRIKFDQPSKQAYALLARRDTADAAECRRILFRLMTEFGWESVFPAEWATGAVPASAAEPDEPAEFAEPAAPTELAEPAVPAAPAEPAPLTEPAALTEPAEPDAPVEPTESHAVESSAAHPPASLPAERAPPVERAPSVEYLGARSRRDPFEGGDAYVPEDHAPRKRSPRLEVEGADELGRTEAGRAEESRKRSRSPDALDQARDVRRRTLAAPRKARRRGCFPDLDEALARIRAGVDPEAAYRARRVAGWFGLLYCAAGKAELMRLAVCEVCAALGRRPPPPQPEPPNLQCDGARAVSRFGMAMLCALGASSDANWRAVLRDCGAPKRAGPRDWRRASWSARVAAVLRGACDEFGWPAPAADLPDGMPEPLELEPVPPVVEPTDFERLLAATLAEDAE